MKNLKIRYANCPNHKTIIDKKFKNIYVDTDEFKGNISLVKIISVKENWYVEEEKRCIIAPNYFWIEMYPEGENYCITGMYDENMKMKEFYIDISKSTGVEDNIPYEEDLYLDVVIDNHHKIYMLDEDELENALNDNIITKEEFNLAYEVANKLIKNATEENINKLDKFAVKYINLILEIM